MRSCDRIKQSQEFDKTDLPNDSYSSENKPDYLDNERRIPEEIPQFNGSIQKYLSYHLHDIKPLPKYRLSEQSVTIFVFFVVEKTGEISDVKIRKSSKNKLSEESIEKIKSVFLEMPPWVPAYVDGQPKKRRLSQAITIK